MINERKMGRKKLEGIKVDKKSLVKILVDKGYDMKKLSEMCGKESGYISHRFGRCEGVFDATFFKLMCLVLGAEEEDLIYKEKQVAEVGNFDTSIFADIEKRIIDKIESMQIQIDVLEVELTKTRKLCESLEVEIQGTRKASTNASNMAVAIREEMKSLASYDPLGRAKKLIEELLGTDGYAEESEILSSADAVGISKADMLTAKKQLGLQTSFKGYGKNQKATWLRGK